jgi:hypothetical protein
MPADACVVADNIADALLTEKANAPAPIAKPTIVFLNKLIIPCSF